jgi:hypothetical protein
MEPQFNVTYEYILMHVLPKTSLRVRHVLSKQPYRMKGACVQQNLWLCDFGLYFIMKIESRIENRIKR